MHVTKKQIASYVLLPGVLPRLKELRLNSGWFAYLMALIFVATRILPANHPYVSPAEQGKFGVSDILFEARRHLKGGIRHIDQYIIYGAFILGMGLLVGQFVLLAFLVATHAAEASAIPWTGMFSTPVRQNDLALMMLDKVFQIPNMWGSKFNAALAANATPFGQALHQIFFFYNQGMLIIAGLIVLYFLFAVTIETMQTGSPFGQRFKEIFVPIRLILAIAFLLPLGYGFSAGQMIVFKLADWGSGFATNGWLLFNQRAQLNPLGLTADQLLISPKTQEIEDLLRFYSLVHSCRAIYDELYGKDIQPYVAIDSANAVQASGLTFDAAIGYFPNGTVKVIFGEKNNAYSRYLGKVKPYCGSIDLITADTDKDGPKLIKTVYWEFMKDLWNDQNLRAYGTRMANNFRSNRTASTASVSAPGWTNAKKDPDFGFFAFMRSDMQARFNSAMDTVKGNIRDIDGNSLGMSEDLLNYGWGGAGIWFNKIAEYNGAIVSASSSAPTPGSYPAALQWLAIQKKGTDPSLGKLTAFVATFGNGSSLKDMMSGGNLDDPTKDAVAAAFLGQIYNKLSDGNAYGSGGDETVDDNPVAKTFNMIFGTSGLFELRGNQEIHPLAKMSALGKSIIDRAIMYMGGTMIMGGLSGIGSLADQAMNDQSGHGVQAAFAGIGSMFMNFATIGIAVGVVLYYVIPFLPFLYFFFAVGRWVKSIFEAVVGIPLWALAHLRIDGEGIPGPAAANGYFLLLEIALRPILCIFGLMAAVACFSALAIGLDTLFDLVTRNVTGYTPVDAQGSMTWAGKEWKRADIDEFFYTIIYAVLLYMMALSCFKLIDLIPNSVLRFIGTQVSEFNDRMNLEGDLLQYTAVSANQLGRQVGGIALKTGEAAGLTAVAAPRMAMEIQSMMPKPASAPPAGGATGGLEGPG